MRTRFYSYAVILCMKYPGVNKFRAFDSSVVGVRVKIIGPKDYYGAMYISRVSSSDRRARLLGGHDCYDSPRVLTLFLVDDTRQQQASIITRDPKLRDASKNVSPAGSITLRAQE